MNQITPYDIHIGEWVYGHHAEGSDTQANDTDVFYPVCIDTIKADGVETEDGESYSFEQLSPIPFDGESVAFFNWSRADNITVLKNWQTKKRFVRYKVGKRQPRDINGLESIHQVQQWYYQTYKKPLVLTLQDPGLQ